MTDRLSQLQDQVNYLASLFCDATGVLQSQAKPSKFENFAASLSGGYDEENENKPQQQSIEELKANFAELITSTAKKIDSLIDSLPDDQESNEQLQEEQLRQLEIENAVAAKQLEYVTGCAEDLLKQIQEKIAQIAQTQLSIQQELRDV